MVTVRLTFKVLATLVVMGNLLLAPRALAYNKDSHLKITAAAYQVMRAASSGPATPGEVRPEDVLKSPGACATGTGLCGATVTLPEWSQFVAEVDDARRKIGTQASAVPNTPSGGGMCFVGDQLTQVANFPVRLTDRHFWKTAPDETNDCGLGDFQFTPPRYGIYNQLNVQADGVGMQGLVLGWHAKHRDDDLDETTIQTFPIVGTALEAADEAYEEILGAFLLPFVCGFQLIFEDADGCAARARAIADDLDPIDVLKGILPGINLPQSESYIGFWHLINVRDDAGLYESYDTPQGMTLTQGGPEGRPGDVDHAVTLGSQLLFMTIDHDDSKGATRYEITNPIAGDNMRPTDGREGWEWESDPFGDTQFTPLSNLAYYGFYDASRPFIERIGWPLHAIGDATVPMHVVATPGFGHAPYESWVSANDDHLVGYKCADWSSVCPAAQLEQDQLSQAHRVLEIAYRWRQYLRTHGLRSFIVALAGDTLDSVGREDEDAWAFCDMCSSFYALNEGGVSAVTLNFLMPQTGLSRIGFEIAGEEIATNPTSYYDHYRAESKGLVESAMGAKIAFLIWAAEQEIDCMPRGSYGCVNAGECCLGTTPTGPEPSFCVDNGCTGPGPI